MTPEQTADLALRAGRDTRRVERVRALLDGREWVPAAEVREALEGKWTDVQLCDNGTGSEIERAPAVTGALAPSATAKQPDRTTPW